MFLYVIAPWFESIVYKGVLIAGSWKSTVQLTPENFKCELSILVSQKGHKLSGEIIARYTNTLKAEDIRTRRLNFTGEIIDNNIILTYRSSIRSITSLGTYLLKLVRGGEELKGNMLAIDGISGEVLSYEDVVWKRE